MQLFSNNFITYIDNHREIAQLGRALGSGLRGRGFESRFPDHLSNAQKLFHTDISSEKWVVLTLKT